MTKLETCSRWISSQQVSRQVCPDEFGIKTRLFFIYSWSVNSLSAPTLLAGWQKGNWPAKNLAKEPKSSSLGDLWGTWPNFE